MPGRIIKLISFDAAQKMIQEKFLNAFLDSNVDREMAIEAASNISSDFQDFVEKMDYVTLYNTKDSIELTKNSFREIVKEWRDGAILNLKEFLYSFFDEESKEDEENVAFIKKQIELTKTFPLPDDDTYIEIV